MVLSDVKGREVHGFCHVRREGDILSTLYVTVL